MKTILRFELILVEMAIIKNQLKTTAVEDLALRNYLQIPALVIHLTLCAPVCYLTLNNCTASSPMQCIICLACIFRVPHKTLLFIE